MSRQGQSDFHTLAASSTGIVAFDGALRVSRDGKAWQDNVPVPAAPVFAGRGAGRGYRGGNDEAGLICSTDGARTWTAVTGASLLGLVDWAGGRTAVGVTADGTVFVSTDDGQTWQRRGSVHAQSQAVGAGTVYGGGLRVLVVTGEAVLQSTDGAATFSQFPHIGLTAVRAAG